PRAVFFRQGDEVRLVRKKFVQAVDKGNTVLQSFDKNRLDIGRNFPSVRGDSGDAIGGASRFCDGLSNRAKDRQRSRAREKRAQIFTGGLGVDHAENVITLAFADKPVSRFSVDRFQVAVSYDNRGFLHGKKVPVSFFLA